MATTAAVRDELTLLPAVEAFLDRWHGLLTSSSMLAPDEDATLPPSDL